MAQIELLKQQIRMAEHELLFAKTSGQVTDELALLFTGNWHDSFPRNLVLNQTLTPVEKVLWQALRLSIASPQKPGSTPKRSDLAMMVNCSPPTITTARQMLRLCRYMTLCSVVRDRGRFVGEIYLLHDEPMDLNTTLELDPSYLDFLEVLTRRGNKAARLRKEAGSILKDLRGMEVSPVTNRPTHQMAERVHQGLTDYTKEPVSAQQYRMHLGAPQAPEKKTKETEFETASITQEAAVKPSQNKLSTEASKNFTQADNRSKNFAPGGFSNNPDNFQPISSIYERFHQSKNFALGQNLIENDQSKIFTMAVCSYRSSSKPEILNSACAREVDGATDFQQFRHTELTQGRYTADRIPEYGDDAEPQPIFRRSTAKPDHDSNREPKPTPGYRTLDLDAQSDNTEEFQALIARFLPEIQAPQLEPYVTPTFFLIQPQIPFIAQLLKRICATERRDILIQCLARKAGYVHGWCHDDIQNPVGFIKTLITKLKRGQFVLDTFAMELLRAVKENDKVRLHDNHQERTQGGFVTKVTQINI